MKRIDQFLSRLNPERKRKLREHLKQAGKRIPVTLYTEEEVKAGVAEAEGAIKFGGTIEPEEGEALSWTKQDEKQILKRLKRMRHLNKILERPISALKGCTGLVRNEAKTVIYWTIATYGLDVLDVFSPLVLYGLPETGKSSILRFIAKLLGLSEDDFISTTSQAAFRDLLAERRIALVEEGDKVDEDLILKRYSKQTGQVDINRPVKPWKYELVPGNIYGATVLHKRLPFEDLALQSRAITIGTKKTGGIFFEPELTDKDRDGLKEVWDDAWSRFSHYEASGRTENNWRPLIIVALALGDLDWIRYANEMQQLTKKDLAGDTEFEPEQILVYVIDYFRGEPNQGFVYLNKIIEHLDNYQWKPTPKRLAKMLRGMGFEVKHHKLGFAIELKGDGEGDFNII